MASPNRYQYMSSRKHLLLNLTRTITARHLILRLRLPKLLASFIAKLSHNRIFRTKPLRVMRCPSNMRLVENIRPFRVVLLLLALRRHLVHEVLASGLAAALKYLQAVITYPSSLERSEPELSFQSFPVVA
jgi:hypothetical protein